MAVIYRRRRRLSRGECIFLGIVTTIITALLTFSTVSTFLKGEITIAGPIVMPLVSIPWPIYFFSKARSMAKAAEAIQKKKAEQARQKQQEPQQKQQETLQNQQTQHREQTQQSRARAAYLQQTRLLEVAPIVVSSPAGTYTATGDFVISWCDGKVCCFPEQDVRGMILGKFRFRDRIWHFTNLAPENVKTEIGSNPPLAPMETREVIPFPNEMIYHTGPQINGITMIRAGWK